MSKEPKKIPAECGEIPAEWLEAIEKRNAARRAEVESVIGEPIDYMAHARRGWMVAYIMTAVCGVLAGLCVWLVGAVM